MLTTGAVMRKLITLNPTVRFIGVASSLGAPWGISLDVDALNPELAPGVSTPVNGGLKTDELQKVLRGILRDRQCIGLEIAEYNPLRDQHEQTLQLILSLIDAASAPDADTQRRGEAGFGARNSAPLPI